MAVRCKVAKPFVGKGKARSDLYQVINKQGKVIGTAPSEEIAIQIAERRKNTLESVFIAKIGKVVECTII